MNETSKPTAPQWLLSRDGKKYGPMTSGQLKQLCRAGKIVPADLICRAGSDRWIPAGEVRGLFPAASPTPELTEQAPIHPVEEATASASKNADAYWRTVGSLFCIANLAACGVVGLVKSPPATVQAMESVMESTRRVRTEFQRINKELNEKQLLNRTMEKVNRDFPGIP